MYILKFTGSNLVFGNFGKEVILPGGFW